MANKPNLEPGLSMSPNGLTVKGKPRDVMRMLNDLEETHGPDATVKDIYHNTMQALLHPIVPVDVKDRT